MDFNNDWWNLNICKFFHISHQGLKTFFKSQALSEIIPYLLNSALYLLSDILFNQIQRVIMYAIWSALKSFKNGMKILLKSLIQFTVHYIGN